MPTFDPNDDLAAMALQFRGPAGALAATVPAALRDVVASRLAVWLLDETFHTLKTDDQRDQWRVVRALHQRRIDGEAVDEQAWEASKAGCLAATRLWPAEWLGDGGFPTKSPLPRAVMAAACAWRRSLSSEAEKLALWESVHARLIYECLLHRTPQLDEESRLQVMARNGDAAPYQRWLEMSDDPAARLYAAALQHRVLPRDDG